MTNSVISQLQEMSDVVDYGEQKVFYYLFYSHGDEQVLSPLKIIIYILFRTVFLLNLWFSGDLITFNYTNTCLSFA